MFRFKVIMNIGIKLFAIAVVLSYLVSCHSCCDISSAPWNGYDRVRQVMNNAWKHCRTKIRQDCMAIGSQFCQEPYCQLTYDDWEHLKPRRMASCQPFNGSINILCKLLFEEECSSLQNGTIRIVRQQSITTLAISILFLCVVIILR